ncbi:hypothetical protein NHF48_004115 [Sphingomonas sp. H160509]|uniref:hypothetical protein n=1 Tax=Sphingomonas sp. H160509 TaxID=2955313 RepID=UPI0021E9810F|nr:hypothetical protein [Sphingomonas sp. H160509]MDD1450358.1 hypothetical protein [Sphingomonas sp. H160509]
MPCRAAARATASSAWPWNIRVSPVGASISGQRDDCPNSVVPVRIAETSFKTSGTSS